MYVRFLVFISVAALVFSNSARADELENYKGFLSKYSLLIEGALGGKPNNPKEESEFISTFAVTLTESVAPLSSAKSSAQKKVKKIYFALPSKIIDVTSMHTAPGELEKFYEKTKSDQLFMENVEFESFNKKLHLFLYAVDAVRKEPLVLNEELALKIIPMTPKSQVAVADSIGSRTQSMLGCVPNFSGEMNVCSFRRKEEGFFEADLLVQEKAGYPVYVIRSQSLAAAYDDLALQIQVEMSRLVRVTGAEVQPAPVGKKNILKELGLLKQSTAKIKLAGIYTALMAFKAEYGAFTTDFEALGIESQSQDSHSAYICGFAKASTAKIKNYPKVLKPDQRHDFYKNLNDPKAKLARFFTKDSVLEKDHFKVSCVGNIDSDEDLDIWTIDQKKALVNVKSDIDP